MPYNVSKFDRDRRGHIFSTTKHTCRCIVYVCFSRIRPIPMQYKYRSWNISKIRSVLTEELVHKHLARDTFWRAHHSHFFEAFSQFQVLNVFYSHTWQDPTSVPTVGSSLPWQDPTSVSPVPTSRLLLCVLIPVNVRFTSPRHLFVHVPVSVKRFPDHLLHYKVSGTVFMVYIYSLKSIYKNYS